VNRVLLEEITRRGIGGVLVTLPDLDEERGRDLRPPGETALRVRIWTGRVEEIATLADGERFAADSLAARSNRPEHAFIREGSPVTAGGERGLLRPLEIEEYAARLSRQPGRRVSPVLRPGTLPGATRLEYHVAEQKPWLAYAQVSNTGTEATHDWRTRFGASHSQLLGRDDVLSLDYVTDFGEVHALWGEYGGPVWRMPRLRWRVDSAWSQYDASDVGLAELDFSGDETQVGGRLQANVFQHRDLFLDVFAGLRWQRIGVDHSITGDAESDFLMPGGGLYATRVGEVWSFAAEAGVAHNIDSVSADDDELEILGRPDPTADFTLFTWQTETAFYPLTLLRRASWREESELGAYDFVHELAFESLGQIAFDDARLVPQLQQVAGGLYSVRGYEQSVTAGDSVAIVRAEYRVHLPRLLEPSQDAAAVPLLGSFRVRPESAFTFPDWDLIARAFVDAAHVVQYAGADINEENETIHALGFGLELRLLRYFSARLDVAFPQRRLEDNDPELDKPRLHTVISVLY
jgi:hemolysin activation/secretion protein